jgi:hypothetical protein
MNRIRGHLTFANTVSLIALFVALGGTSYAVATLGKNTVGPKQIKKNAVRASEIRKGAVRSNEVRNGSLRTGDFRAGELPATNTVVRRGPVLTPGTNGAGAYCVDGVPGGSKGQYNDSTPTPELQPCNGGAAGNAFATVQCAPDEVATGGGYSFQAGKRHAQVLESRPNPAGVGQTPTGWRVQVGTLTLDATNTTPVTPYVICAKP